MANTYYGKDGYYDAVFKYLVESIKDKVLVEYLMDKLYVGHIIVWKKELNCEQLAFEIINTWNIVYGNPIIKIKS